ncbi:type I polyketide synthase [Umezakia ovalisporum]|uniref:type I polyketide synthase n=1 Tax=Umezakia ovalisporum TaxID=75695 RepID=UPI0024737279|nr:beta-ketoacyl synthase N-terminal-like domain-containing protein [Umezakia ovalisporum]MDH6089801.1 thioesterase domain-containing protein [Umezakia ovalisporum Ak1311]
MIGQSIAIIGMGCRFPNANSPSEFWEVIRDGVDTITDVPMGRPREMKGRGGFLKAIDKFDAAFFGISSEEAIKIDPQHRLLLETTWEALEDAGLVPANLAGTNTGVFTGATGSEYLKLLNEDSTFSASIGTVECMLANRVSSYFDFRGASLVINTTCSSGLVAIDQACRNLWNGEISLALVSGTNLTFSSVIASRFDNAGLISGNGRCKVFDAKADGYVRGEGIGVVVLKPLSQAQADGDRVYAVIRGSGVNHNGRGNGLTAPSMQAQIELLQKVYQQADINPSSINYIEAHGTATLIGDALEMKALGAVVGKNRTPDNPCGVGCVKTNIGHTEAASGIAGLIKVALSLYHRQIPPTLHFQEPNPGISFAKLGLKVQQTLETLPEDTGLIRAGVSSLGLGGTNAHVILESVPSQAKVELNPAPLQIFTLTAKSPTALQALAQRYQAFLEHTPEASLSDICFTANTRRSQFQHRIAVITESKEQLKIQLNSYVCNEESLEVFSGKITRRKSAPVGFIFTGESHKIKPIIQLFYQKNNSAIDSLLEPLELMLDSYVGKSFLELIKEDNLENSLHSKLVDFICEYAVAQLFQYWGINPAMSIAYGMGTYTALVIAEVLTLEDVIFIITENKNFKSLHNFQLPTIPVVSSLTGNTIKVAQSITPEQWQKEFDFNNIDSQNLANLSLDNNSILLDVCSLSIKNYDKIESSDHVYILFATLIQFWLIGTKIDWSKVEDYKQCSPISLPTYPFEGESYWINLSPNISRDKIEGKNKNHHNNLICLEEEFVAPRNDIEQQIANIWQKVLGHESIGIHDNFFELGGNSILSASLVSEMEKNFDQHFSLTSFFQFPTIAEIAHSMNEPLVDLPNNSFINALDPKDYHKLLIINLGRNGLRPNPYSLMIALNSQNNKPPFFFCANGIHEATPLSKYLEKEYSFYFLESGYTIFFLEDRTTEENIKALASHHVKDILAIQPEGDYLLAGFSFGSLVAYEIAKQLEQKGKKVAFLGILDMFGNDLRFNFFKKQLTKILTVNSKKLIQLIELIQLIMKTIFYTADKKPDEIPQSTYNPNNTSDKKYIMDRYQGKITLFIAQGRVNSRPTEKLISLLFYRYGWSQESLAQIHKVPGSHASMVQEPNVKILADKIQCSLTKDS